MATATTTVVTPGPRTVTMTRASSSPGNASRMSITRMTTLDCQRYR